MNTDDLSEEELVRAREFVSDLNEGAAPLGLHPQQAQIGSTASGRTAIVIDFRIDEAVFADE